MIGLCVGHSRAGDSGAMSVGNITEYEYNCALVDLISSRIKAKVKIYDAYEGRGYTTAMKWLGRKMKADGISVAVELHFNAATPKATGHEWLYWHTSEKGRLLARTLRDSFEDSFPQFTSRGIKPRKKGSRGSAFLRNTHCPAVICEPFFGTNEDDWELATQHSTGIASAIAGGIILYKDLVGKW